MLIYDSYLTLSFLFLLLLFLFLFHRKRKRKEDIIHTSPKEKGRSLSSLPFSLLMEKYISEEIVLFGGASAVRAGGAASAAIAGLGTANTLFPPPFCLVYIAACQAQYCGYDKYNYKVCHAAAPERAYSAFSPLSAFLIK